MYSGPLPPPAVLQGYDQVLPGTAERIIRQFEAQSTHRRRIESLMIVSRLMGQVFGFLIAAGGLGGGVYLVMADKNVAGFVSILTTLAVLATAFFGQSTQAPKPQSPSDTE